MMDRMKHYSTLESKVNLKVNDLKNLTSHELYKLDNCKSHFLCHTMSRINESYLLDPVTDLDRINLLIELVTLEAIDLRKTEDTLEMVLQVT